MEKKSAIQKLNELKENKCEIAEVIINISNGGKVKHANESIIVRLVDTPSNEDCIDNSKHWELFDTIKDFEDNTYYRHSAHETYNVDYISDFVEVKEFATDRDEVRIAI